MYSITWDTNSKVWKDFTSIKYDVQQEDHKKPKKQKHLVKDYTTNVKYSFPRFTNICMLYEPRCGCNQANKIIESAIIKGQNKHWTNKTLSYMKKDIVGKRILKSIFEPIIDKYFDGKVAFVDATANIGGDTILMGMSTKISSVKAYEPCHESFQILKNNINLYQKFLNNNIKIINDKFDYDCKDAVVLIDPPFEDNNYSTNNKDNFNMSIEPAPIYFIVEKTLNAGAKAIFLNAPINYKYNINYAIENKHDISCYHIGSKDMKIYVIMRGEFVPKGYKLVPKWKDLSLSTQYEKFYESQLNKLY